jgi:hypothetical protein
MSLTLKYTCGFMQVTDGTAWAEMPLDGLGSVHAPVTFTHA